MGPEIGLIIIILGGFLIWICRNNIRGLIDRTKSAGPLTFGPTQSRGETKAPTKTADDLIRGIDSGLIREIEDQFKQNLEGMSDSEKIKALSRLFAASLWGYMAMNTYCQIFGS